MFCEYFWSSSRLINTSMSMIKCNIDRHLQQERRSSAMKQVIQCIEIRRLRIKNQNLVFFGCLSDARQHKSLLPLNRRHHQCKGCIKMFPTETGGGPVHAKRGASQSMQQGGLVHAKPRSLTCADFEYVPTSANILPLLLPSPVSLPAYYSASVHVSVQ